MVIQYFKKLCLTLLVALTFIAKSQSQSTLLSENFSYNLSDTLSNILGSGWTPIATVNTVNKVPVVAGLTYAGYAMSNIGNAVLVKNTGQDIGKAFIGTNIRSNSVYASFLMNVSAAQANGDYFFTMLDSALNGINYRARTFIKSSGTGFRIGVSKSGGAAVAGFNPTDLVFGTTYQVVVKYTIVSGATNDSVKLFINPVLGANEPAATSSAVVTENDITLNSTTGLGGIVLRQGTSTNAPTLTIDGIIVGQTWASVTPFHPSIKMNPTSVVVNETLGIGTVSLELVNSNSSATIVDVVYKGGSATAGSDFIFNSQTVTFPPNSNASQTFTFPIINDNLNESNESIILVLRNQSNDAIITNDSILTITISKNDQPVQVKFIPTTSSIYENAGTANVSIEVLGANSNSNPTSFDVSIKGGTAIVGSDYIFSNLNLTIPAYKDTIFNLQITLLNDNLVEGNESIFIAIRNISNFGDISVDSIFTITLKDDDVPFYNISDLKIIDSLGNPTFPNSTPLAIKGVVYSPNLTIMGLQFSIIDSTGAITAFHAVNNFSYTVNLGDSLAIYGELLAYNGLIKISIDSLKILSIGNILKSPKKVTKLKEEDESNIVKINKVHLINSAQWVNSGSSFDVLITNGIDTLKMVILNSVDIFNMNAPIGNFNLTGVVYQFDQTNPRSSGYYLVPRRSTDISTNEINQNQFVCYGNLPNNLTGSIKYITNSTYQWISSITDSVLNFTNSIGVNNLKDYQPNNILQPTWYRRVVQNGVILDTSNVVKIDFLGIPVSKFSVQTQNQCLNNNLYSFLDSSFVIGSGNIITYSWDFGDNTFSSIKNPTKQYSNSGTYSVRCIVISNNSCSDTSYNIIKVYEKQNTIINILNTTQCLKSNLFSFSDETQINNDIIFSRIWKFGDGSESALKNPIKIYNSFGTFNVKLITITDKGCVDSASQIINIIKDPIAGKIAGKIDNLQPNQPYLYNINQQLSHSYNWLIDNGAIVSGQGTNAVTVQWFSNGLGNLKCILTNSSGCVDTAYISLNIGTTGYSQNLDSKINIFPNPTFDIVFIDGLEENTIISLEIFDIHGKLILLDKIKKYGFLDFSNYEQGVYFVKIGDVVKRVIKL
jgi:hypothetical protein